MSDTTFGVFVSNNPYMIEKRMDVSTNTRSSTGAVRREAGRARRGAYRALISLGGKRVLLIHIREAEWTQEQIDIIESHGRVGEIVGVNPLRAKPLRVGFGNNCFVWVARDEIELLKSASSSNAE